MLQNILSKSILTGYSSFLINTALLYTIAQIDRIPAIEAMYGITIQEQDGDQTEFTVDGLRYEDE